MSEITGAGAAAAHEAYAFACMRCGHGWENAYDIEHHIDSTGRNFVVYKCEGVRVPSPLSSPSCANCGGHVVRIMQSGRVSSVRALMTGQGRPAGATTGAGAGAGSRASRSRAAAKASATGGVPGAVAATEATAPVAGDKPLTDGSSVALPDGTVHHWHLADLLHPFHHRR